MPAAIGAVRSLPAATRYIPVRTGTVLAPPPGVAIIPLLSIAQRAHTICSSSRTG